MGVTLSTSDGEIHDVAAFTQKGKHVTGWLGLSESDSIPITLAFKGNKLTIWTHPQPGRNVAFDRCDVTMDGAKWLSDLHSASLEGFSTT